jgi:hypothetical protein
MISIAGEAAGCHARRLSMGLPAGDPIPVIVFSDYV